MRHPSELPGGFRIGVMIALGFSLASAQEGTWSFSVSGGWHFLRMGNVNETLDKTVRDWNYLELVPIGPFEHFSTSPSFGFRASYRYDRDMNVSFSASFFSASVKNAHKDASVSLSLERSIGANEFLLGLGYLFPPLVYDMEASVTIDVGLIYARADARTYSTRTEKLGAGDTTYVSYDSEANYKKSKLIAIGGTALTWNIFSPVFVRAEASYKFANVGFMQGVIRKIAGTFDEESRTHFDFSAFSVRLGVGISF